MIIQVQYVFNTFLLVIRRLLNPGSSISSLYISLVLTYKHCWHCPPTLPAKYGQALSHLQTSSSSVQNITSFLRNLPRILHFCCKKVATKKSLTLVD